MLFKRINLISSFVNNFNKTKRTDFLNKKFIEEENCSFFDENGNRKIKSKQSEEKKIKFDNYIIGDIKNYRKNEENKKNYFNKFIRFRNVKEDIKKKKNKKRFPDIINLKKRLDLLEEYKSFNNDGLRYNYASFLIEGKNRNNEFNNSNSLNKFNYSTFNSINQISRKSKFMDSINSKIKLNIIRKRIHMYKYTNLIQSQKKLLNLKLNNIKKIESFKKNMSQNETSNTNNNTNEINLTNDEGKEKTYNKNIKNIPQQKYSLKNFLAEQDYLRISGKKLKWENKLKMRKTFAKINIISKYGQNKAENNLFKKKSKNDFQTDMTYISTDRRNDDIIKPIRLKNFDEWKNDTERKNKLKMLYK